MKKYKGSITVFMALSFVLIFSLVLISLEEARSAALRSYAGLILAAAVESSAADFYRPLFDKYGLFALNLGYGKRQPDIGKLESRIRENAEYNSDEVLITGCRLDNTTPYLSDGGNIMRRQMMNEEKSKLAETMVTEFMDKIGFASKKSKAAEAMTRKIGLESELYKIDEYTLELMRLIDGVKVKLGVFTGECKGYSVEESFVKQFFVLPVSSINAGINNPEVYVRLSDCYEDPIGMLEDIELMAYQYCGYVELTEQLKRQLEAYGKALGQASSQAAQGIAIAMSYTSQMLSEYTELAQIRLSELTEETDSLRELCVNTGSRLSEARQVAEQIGALQASLQPAVLAYEEFLSSFDSDEDDDESLLQPFTDSLETMKAYVGLGTDVNVTNFAMIRSTIICDEAILAEAGADKLLVFPGGSETAEIKTWANRVLALKSVFEKFDYAGFQFDYGGVGKTDTVQIIEDGVTAGLSAGFLSVITDEGTELSTAKMDTSLLPEIIDADKEEDSPQPFLDANDNAGRVATGIFEGNIAGKVSDFLKKEMSEVYEKGMEVMYVHDHFNGFDECLKKEGDYLSYEQEYLLCGNSVDTANLTGAILRIMGVRTFFSAIYLFTDRTANELAGATAAAIGFLSLPFLTIVIKYGILLLWAMAQAMVETSAILMGKKVPICTDSQSLSVHFGELPGLSPELIKTKAKSFAEGGPSFDYGEYLMMFLLLAKEEALLGRMANLIQENLRYEYDENFLLSNCLAAYSVSMDVCAAPKFIRDFGKLYSFAIPSGYQVTVTGKTAYEGVNQPEL